MKKYFFGVFALGALLFFLLSFFAAKAQTDDADTESPSVTVASVSIYKTKVEAQEGNSMQVSFDLYNRKDVQTGVKYAVWLVKRIDETGVLIHDQSYSEVLSLGENETVHRKVTYQAPIYLEGKYEVWVVSKTEKGFPLAQGLAGSISLTGNNQYVQLLPDTCYLTVENEANQKEYAINQGVDVLPQENLVAHCEAINNFSSAVEAVPSIETFVRTTLGKKVDTKKLAPVSFEPQEKKKVTLTIPKADSPQAYDAKLQFNNAKDQGISNNVIFHYVVRGDSATIENLRLDKNSYRQGDLAQVTFNWAGAADSFFNSRLGATKVSGLSLELQILDDTMNCSEKMTKNLNEDTEDLNFSFSVPIIANCINPNVTLVVKNKDGKVLDQAKLKLNNIPVVKQPVDNSAASQAGSKKTALAFKIIGLLVFIALIILLIIRYWKRRTIFIIFGGSFFLLSCFLGVARAKAETAKISCVGSNGVRSSVTYTYNLDQAEYNVGATAVATGSAHFSVCNNNHVFARGSLEGTINSTAKDILVRRTSTIRKSYDVGLTSANYTVESSPGSYQAGFVGEFIATEDNGRANCSSGNRSLPSIPYTVDLPDVDGVCGPASTNGVAYQDVPTGADLCSVGSATAVTQTQIAGEWKWTWECEGQANGNNSPQCQADIITSGACQSSIPRNCSFPDTNSLCVAGFADNIRQVSSDTMLWDCQGGSAAQTDCGYEKLCDGICSGLAESCTEPAGSQACSQGTPDNVRINGQHWEWTCLGIGAGSSNSGLCDSTLYQCPGVCGNDSGGQVCRLYDLCSVGTPNPATPSLDASGVWSWSCDGINGGASSVCTATKKQCSSYQEVLP